MFQVLRNENYPIHTLIYKFTKLPRKLRRIWSSHKSNYEEFCLLGQCRMPYGLEKVNRRFGGTRHFHLQDWRATQAINHYQIDSKQSSVSDRFLVWYTRWPCRWRRHVPPKRRPTFTRMHNVISQKKKILPMKLLCLEEVQVTSVMTCWVSEGSNRNFSL
jgi:hypothetical protein